MRAAVELPCGWHRQRQSGVNPDLKVRRIDYDGQQYVTNHWLQAEREVCQCACVCVCVCLRLMPQLLIHRGISSDISVTFMFGSFLVAVVLSIVVW